MGADRPVPFRAVGPKLCLTRTLGWQDGVLGAHPALGPLLPVGPGVLRMRVRAHPGMTAPRTPAGGTESPGGTWQEVLALRGPSGPCLTLTPAVAQDNAWDLGPQSLLPSGPSLRRTPCWGVCPRPEGWPSGGFEGSMGRAGGAGWVSVCAHGRLLVVQNGG